MPKPHFRTQEDVGMTRRFGHASLLGIRAPSKTRQTLNDQLHGQLIRLTRETTVGQVLSVQ